MIPLGSGASRSHFESDEIGGLNHWLELAPQAQLVSSFAGKVVNFFDVALRPVRSMGGDDVLTTGRYRSRFQPTLHLAHGRDAGMPSKRRRPCSAPIVCISPEMFRRSRRMI
ncbi:MAG: hypothetical protein VKI83_05690 [Synechococcaceae cyanobacterium]|nr:hypothetical protein [Synechococcaceae cyanobacterium]